MSLTVSNMLTNFNTFFGDSSTDRITDAQRFEYLTEATSWLLEELGNEHSNATYALQYIDGVNYYKVTSVLPDLLVGADLRQEIGDNYKAFTRISPKEMSEKVAQKSQDHLWAIERKDGDVYVVINHPSKFNAHYLAGFNTTTSDNGTWTADTTNSDALNLTYDVNEKKEGAASLNFDVDVSQSANNRATVYIEKSSSDNLSDQEDFGYFMLDVYIPDVTEVSSVTIKYSSDASATPATISNYWSITETVDVNGNALVSGWNKMAFEWGNASVTGSPDAEEIVYYEIVVNYSASQVDDTDFRLDNFYLVRPQELTFHYVSWLVGTDTNGADITSFTASTDVPFFSGRYDQYKYCVAHKATSIAFYNMRLTEPAIIQSNEADKSLSRYKMNFETTKTRPQKTFKVGGVNLRRRKIRRIN